MNDNATTEILDDIPTGSFEDFMQTASEPNEIPIDDETQEELINEINRPKDPMGITAEPDDDSLQAKDLLDDEAFRFSGEMLSFGIDVGAAYLLAWLAHQPLETYRLPPKDLKKLEKVIAQCTRDTKLMLSPWQGLFVVLLAIYGMKVPQVLQARREWEEQQRHPNDYDREDTHLPVRDKSNPAADPTTDADEPTTSAAAGSAGAGDAANAEPTHTNQ